MGLRQNIFNNNSKVYRHKQGHLHHQALVQLCVVIKFCVNRTTPKSHISPITIYSP